MEVHLLFYQLLAGVCIRLFPWCLQHFNRSNLVNVHAGSRLICIPLASKRQKGQARKLQWTNMTLMFFFKTARNLAHPLPPVCTAVVEVHLLFYQLLAGVCIRLFPWCLQHFNRSNLVNVHAGSRLICIPLASKRQKGQARKLQWTNMCLKWHMYAWCCYDGSRFARVSAIASFAENQAFPVAVGNRMEYIHVL